MRIKNRLALFTGLVVALTLSGAGAGFAYFTAGVTASGTVKAGTVAVTQTISPSLLTPAPFTSANRTITGSITLQNIGSVAGTYTTTVPSLASGSSAGLANSVTVSVWPNTTGTDCATQTKPGSAVPTTWKQLTLSGALSAGASTQYCAQTSLDVQNSVSGIASGSTVKPNVSTGLTAGTQWTSTSAPQTPALSFIDDLAPSTPGSLSAGTTSSSSVSLSWTASSDNVGVAKYLVYRNGGSTAIATVNAPTTTFTNTGLTAMTTYTYTVTAVDAAGNSSAVATVTVWTLPDPNTSYTVKASNGRCVDANGSAYNGSGYELIGKNCSSSSASQKWTFQSSGNAMSITSNRGLIWDVANNSLNAGDGVITWPTNGGANQKWLITSLGNSKYQFQAVGSGLCLQMPASNNAQLTQEVCNASSPAQTFTIQ